ncbi:hypothetical protein H2490_002312 [Staphylococcus pseudintermedius]|nr:hypothetical protein [Staphylococcus pseudintermedius]EHT8076769.1 hypothetical protein [Staphylococcus pseudintermedius]EIA5759071.1 hypothetical protein [Staphylococcus pseudintermedius]EIM5216429.1 hypothetical protein [Staphylococcus pseudintermedius]ELD8105560.1 hypothetical protein [Staphylococcus pseudintermedius]
MYSSTYLAMPTHSLLLIDFLKSIAISPHLLIDLMTSISLHSLSCLKMCSSTCLMMPIHLLLLIDFLKSIAISPHLLIGSAQLTF